MKIQDAARETNLTEKSIRYYESIGLIDPARRENGYRDFSQNDIHKLQFLARARRLGFSIEDCRQLLDLYNDKSRASKDVKAIAKAHLTQIDEKIAELQALYSTLDVLVSSCHGDKRPDCPILSDLAGSAKKSNG